MPNYWYSSLSGETFFAPWFEYRNDISSVFIGDGVTNIGSNAFYYCSNMSSVNIPNSVISIESGAFRGCSGLTSVIIPNSVTFIEVFAFRQCVGLTEIINYQEIPQDIHFTVFVLVDQTHCTLLVPAGSIDAYRNADVWKDFVNIKEIKI